MRINVYPTRFEAYEGVDTQMFRVEAIDEHAATVTIDTVVDLNTWDEIAPLIRQCLFDMSMGVEDGE